MAVSGAAVDSADSAETAETVAGEVRSSPLQAKRLSIATAAVPCNAILVRYVMGLLQTEGVP
jgi:hypothetical protein